MTTAEATKTTETTEDTMRRYPLLTAHLICESLGYFTPRAAANAIQSHKKGRSHACEWYLSMIRPGHSLKDIGASTLSRAFKYRRNHRGFMAEFNRALLMVQAELGGYIPQVQFSSWQ